MFHRLIAITVSLSLFLTPPAFALRSEQVGNRPTAATGLEEKLTSAAGLETKIQWASQIPHSLRPSLQRILEGAQVGDAFFVEVGPETDIRQDAANIRIILSQKIVQEEATKRKKEEIQPSEEGPAGAELKRFLSVLRLAPLPEPVWMILGKHSGRKSGEWVKEQILALTEQIEPDRPITFWLEMAGNSSLPHTAEGLDQFLEFEATLAGLPWVSIDWARELEKETLSPNEDRLLRDLFRESLEKISAKRMLSNPRDLWSRLQAEAIEELRRRGRMVYVQIEKPTYEAYLEQLREDIAAAEFFTAFSDGKNEEALSLYEQACRYEMTGSLAGRDDPLSSLILADHQIHPSHLQVITRGIFHEKSMETALLKLGIRNRKVLEPVKPLWVAMWPYLYVRQDSPSSSQPGGRIRLMRGLLGLSLLPSLSASAWEEMLQVQELALVLPDSLVEGWFHQLLPRKKWGDSSPELAHETMRFLREHREEMSEEAKRQFGQIDAEVQKISAEVVPPARELSPQSGPAATGLEEKLTSAAGLESSTDEERRDRILNTLRSRYESWQRYRIQWDSTKRPWPGTAKQLFDHEIELLGTVFKAVKEQTPAGQRIFEFLDRVAADHLRAIPLTGQTYGEVWRHLIARRPGWGKGSPPRDILEQFNAILEDREAREELERLMTRPMANTEPNRYVLEDRILDDLLRDVPRSERLILDRGVSTGETSIELQEHLGGTVIATDRAPVSEATVQLTPFMVLRGFEEHPRLELSAVVQFRQQDIRQEITGLDGRVVLIRDASVLEHLKRDARRRAVEIAFHLASTRQGGLWYHTTSGSASKVPLLSQYIFHVTGPHPADWTLSHAGYLLQLGGKDRSALLSDDQLLEHEMAISRRVLAIRTAALERAAQLYPANGTLDEMGRVVPAVRRALAEAIIPTSQPHQALLASMLEDILLISPWTSLDEYQGNVYRERGVLAQHELAWQFATQKKIDLEQLLDELQSLVAPKSPPAAGLEDAAKNAAVRSAEGLTQRFREIAQQLGLPFDEETPIYLWIGAHLGGTTPEMFNGVFQGDPFDLFQGKRPILLPFALASAEDLGRIVPLLLRHPQFRGADITAPYKRWIPAHAEELRIQLDPMAQKIGVSSFLYGIPAADSGQTQWRAEVLDGEGWVRAFRLEFPVESLKGKDVALFGAGGAGLAVMASLAAEENRPASVTVIEPNQDQRVLAGDILRKIMPEVRIRVYSSEFEARADIANSNLLINATELGKKNNYTPLSQKHLIGRGRKSMEEVIVFDLNWWLEQPAAPGRTRFLEDARLQGARIANGMKMSAQINADFAARWAGHPEAQDLIYQHMYRLTREADFVEAAGLEEVKLRWATQIPGSLRPLLKKILVDAGARGDFSIEIGEYPDIRVDKVTAITLTREVIQKEAALRKQEHLKPGEEGPADRQLRQILPWLFLPPLEEPVRMIFSEHESAAAGQWAADQVPAILEGVDRDRRVVIWLEGGGYDDMPQDVEHLQGQIALFGGSLAQEMSLDSIDWEKELLADSLSPMVQELLETLFRTFEERIRRKIASVPGATSFAEKLFLESASPERASGTQELSVAGESKAFHSKLKTLVDGLRSQGRVVLVKAEDFTSESWINNLRQKVAIPAAIYALYEGHNEQALRLYERFCRTLASLVFPRDAAFIPNIAQYHQEHPADVHLIFRGSMHEPAVIQELSQRGLRYRKASEPLEPGQEAMFRYIQEGAPLGSTPLGRRFLIGGLLGSLLKVWNEHLGLPPETLLATTRISEIFPDQILEGWFHEVAPKAQDGSLDQFEALTWDWLRDHRAELPAATGELFDQLYHQVQTAIAHRVQPVSSPTEPSAPAAGLEEQAVVAVEAEEVSRRVGLEEFLARLPRGKVVVLGAGSAAAQELRGRNPNVVWVNDNAPANWAAALAGLEEDRIVFVGEPATARLLQRILPASMRVVPASGLEEILLALGFPPAALGGIDVSGLEEEFARQHAA